MVLSMEKEFKIIQLVIDTKESLLMECHKAMENIIGIMDPPTKVILNKDAEMDMESGKIQNKLVKFIRVTMF